MTDPMLETCPADVVGEPEAAAVSPPVTDRDDLLVERVLLVEDVSIDGMCGVY
jgi:hypothetical protein